MKPAFDSWYGKFVAALVVTFSRLLLRKEADDEIARRVTEAIILAVAHMPFHLRAPMVILTLLFDVGAVIMEGRTFRHCALPARYLAIWFGSRLRMMRDFVAFHESVFLLRHYSLK